MFMELVGLAGMELSSFPVNGEAVEVWGLWRWGEDARERERGDHPETLEEQLEGHTHFSRLLVQYETTTVWDLYCKKI